MVELIKNILFWITILAGLSVFIYFVLLLVAKMLENISKRNKYFHMLEYVRYRKIFKQYMKQSNNFRSKIFHDMYDYGIVTIEDKKHMARKNKKTDEIEINREYETREWFELEDDEDKKSFQLREGEIVEGGLFEDRK